MRFFYLAAACLFMYFSRGDQPYALAVWLFWIFLLRYFRMSQPLIGYLIAVPVMAVPVYFSSLGMVLLPKAQLLLYSLVVSFISLIPFLLDRMFYRELPRSICFLFFPSLMVSLYYLYSFSGNGTWGNPAYALSGDKFLLQLASLTGIWGFIFMSGLFASIFNFFWESGFEFKQAQMPILIFLVLYFLIYSYGALRLRYASVPERAVQAAALTPTLQQRSDLKKTLLLLRSGNTMEGVQIEILQQIMAGIFENLLEKSDQMAGVGADLVAWSEGSVILFESDKEHLLSKACDLAKSKHIYLGLAVIVVSESALKTENKKNPGFRNILILINSEGRIAIEHQKARLVAGLEAPFFNQGNGVFQFHDTSEGRVSAAICYEMIFPNYIRKAGKLETEILLAPSSDWKNVRNIHYRMAVLRAVENGFSILRPTSDGITAAVDPYGRIMGQVDYFVSNTFNMITILPVERVNTLYTAIGDWLAWMCLIFSAALISITLFRKHV